MQINFGKIVLGDWQSTSSSEWVRCSRDCGCTSHPTVHLYRVEISSVELYRAVVKGGQYNWAWAPNFTGSLAFLNNIYKSSNDPYIFEHADAAKIIIDNFIERINKLKIYA